MQTNSKTRRWAAVPATRSSSPVLKTKLYVVVAAIGLAALSGPAAIAYTMTRPTPAPVAVGTNTAADGYARAVAEDFLSGRDTAVPTADGVDKSFGRTTSAKDRKPLQYSGLSLVSSSVTAGTMTKTSSSPTYNVSKFLFQLKNDDGTTKPMKLDVTMLITDDGPVLGAMPALRPADMTSKKYQSLDYQEVGSYKEGSPSQAVTDLVDKWAKAYASGDANRLRELVRDPAPTTYQGLGGFTASRTPEIRSYVNESPANLKAVHGVAPTDPIYVRVRVWFQSTSAERFETSADYDLLLFDAKGNSPYVVAWGAAGTAPLTPFTDNSNRH